MKVRRIGARRHRSALVVFLVGAVTTLPAAAMAQTPPARTVTLDEAVGLALARDPGAVAAQSAVASAQADVLQARGAWLPSFDLSSGYTNSSNQRFDQATGQLVSESYIAQASGSYNIFSGGRRLAQQRAAGAELDAADAELRALRFEVILRTTEAFYAVAAAAEIEVAARQRLERALQQLSFARTRLEVGTATASDLLRAELEVGNAELAVAEAESDRRTAGLRLGRQVGIAAEVQAEPAALPDEAAELPPLEELIGRAAAGSPSVIAAEATLDSRHAAKLATMTSYLPSVRLSGGYDWFAFQFPPDQQSWSMRLLISLPLFNGFQREATVQRAAAAQRAAEARARDAALGARVAVETAVQEIALAERRVTISDRTVALAREDLRVQEERYQIGVATILDLQASQVALAEAEIAVVRARQALGTAVARLEAILGEKLGE